MALFKVEEDVISRTTSRKMAAVAQFFRESSTGSNESNEIFSHETGLKIGGKFKLF